MKANLPFESNVAECQSWYEQFPFVFQSEVEAIRQMLPAGDNLQGIEVGLGLGRFSKALGFQRGIELPNVSNARGNVPINSAAYLPYKEFEFDFVLIAWYPTFFNDLRDAFREAYRVLKKDGVFVIGFLDRNSAIGQYYDRYKPKGDFFHRANFHTVEKIVSDLIHAGFRQFDFCQTLFKPLHEIKRFEPAKPSYGLGSFVVVQAAKKYKKCFDDTRQVT